MAIYHCEVKTISRKSGRTSTAAAAYRAGEKIKDTRTLEVFDYTKKKTVISADVVLPSDVTKKITRSDLWNMAEGAEKRKDATVAREYVIALPDELPREAQRELALKFAQALADRYHVAADVALHAPDRRGDERNIHAHILTTTRRITERGELADKTRELDGMASGRQQVTQIRELWAQMANAELARHGRDERIDHRTLKAQGIDRAPQIHVGVHATQMERRGIETEKGRRNKEIQNHNAEVAEVQREVAEYNREITEYRRRASEEQTRAKQADTPTQKPLEATKTPERENYNREQVEAALRVLDEAKKRHKARLQKKLETETAKKIAVQQEQYEAKAKEREELAKEEPKKKLLERQSTYHDRWRAWSEAMEAKRCELWNIGHSIDLLKEEQSRINYSELPQEAYKCACKEHPEEAKIVAWDRAQKNAKREQDIKRQLERRRERQRGRSARGMEDELEL